MRSGVLALIHQYLMIGMVTILIAGCATAKYDAAAIPAAATVPSNEGAAGATAQSVKSNEMLLGVGDTVDVEVYRHAELKRSLRIDESGKINYPLVGDVEVAGLNAFQLRGKLQEELSKYYVDPQVMVSVKGMHSQKVYVLGEVTKPGVFTLETTMSVLEAISQAGGFTLDAKNESVMLIRGSRTKPQVVKLDLESVLKLGNMSQDVQIAGGDIVYVPATFIADASRFSVYLKNILSPILMFEQGVVQGEQAIHVIEGKPAQQTNVIVTIP